MASVEYHGQKGRAAYERKAVEKESIGAGIARLYRGKVLDSSSWTPGSIQPTRLAIIDSTTAVVASGGEMYRIEMDMSSDFQEPLREGNEGFNVSLPVFFDSISSSACIQTNSHKYEIQSISSGPCDSILSIDALGSCRMIHLNREIKISSKKTKVNETFEASCASESSWAGITTAANDRTTVITAHSFGRQVATFDSSTLECTWKATTSQFPTALASFLPNKSTASVVVTAEMNEFSIWDIRQDKAVAREVPSLNKTLYTVACSPDGLSVAVGGEDKTVYIYDSRNWKVSTRWKCPLKYDLVSIQFSPTDPGLCYLAGTDNEILSGQFKRSEPSLATKSMLQQNHRLGFRGESRWIGISAIANDDQQDLIVAACETGCIYAVTPANAMVSF